MSLMNSPKSSELDVTSDVTATSRLTAVVLSRSSDVIARAGAYSDDVTEAVAESLSPVSIPLSASISLALRLPAVKQHPITYILSVHLYDFHNEYNALMS